MEQAPNPLPPPSPSQGVRDGIKGNFEQWRACLAAFTKVTAAEVSTKPPRSHPVVVEGVPPQGAAGPRIQALLVGGSALPVCLARAVRALAAPWCDDVVGVGPKGGGPTTPLLPTVAFPVFGARWKPCQAAWAILCDGEGSHVKQPGPSSVMEKAPT